MQGQRLGHRGSHDHGVAGRSAEGVGGSSPTSEGPVPSAAGPVPDAPSVLPVGGDHAASVPVPACHPALSALFAVLLAVLFAVFAVSAYWGWRLAHPPRVLVRGNPAIDARLIWRCLPNPTVLPPCTAGVLPPGIDRIPLSGWILPVALEAAPRAATGAAATHDAASANWPGTSPGQWSRRTVVFVSDAGQNRLQSGFPTLSVARELTQLGYNVVLFDTRDTGASGGDEIGFGSLEAKDVEAVVAYLRTLGPPGGYVALWGFGTGADAALLAAVHEPDVAAVIADSPYASLPAFLRRNVPAWTGLPAFPFSFTVPWLMGLETGAHYGAFDPLRAAATLGAKSLPLLFIDGGADPITPPAGVRALYAAASDKDGSTLVVAGAGHLQAYQREPGRYMQRVLQVLGEMR